jgi:hypothetical protein
MGTLRDILTELFISSKKKGAQKARGSQGRR